MTTPVLSLLPNARQVFFSATGVPLVGGTVETYIPGTLTLVDTYADQNAVTVNTHPITLDSAGSCIIWTQGSIRQIVKDSLGNTIWDNVSNAPIAFGTGLLIANNLSDLQSTSTAQTNLGLGSSATYNVGTSGSTVPLLNGTNTWAQAQDYDAAVDLGAGGTLTQGPTLSSNSIGYLGVPQNPQSTGYTLVLTDAGGEIFFSGSVSCTIPANGSVNFPVGTIITATWDQTYTGTLVPGAGVTLRWLQGNVTGTRTITGPGFAVVRQVKTNEWWLAAAANVT